MNTESQAAEQVVNMSLKGMEEVIKISGYGAKNLSVYLYTLMKDQKRTKGKTRLKTMLNSGDELKIFEVNREDLQVFQREAKKYGVLYCALKDKNDVNGKVDIMVKARDASKVDRIMDKFDLASIDTATIKKEITDSKEKAKETKIIDKANDLLNVEPKKSLQQETAQHQSGKNSTKQKQKQESIPTMVRSSIRKELNDIKQRRSKNTPAKKVPVKTKMKTKKRGR